MERNARRCAHERRGRTFARVLALAAFAATLAATRSVALTPTPGTGPILRVEPARAPATSARRWDVYRRVSVSDR